MIRHTLTIYSLLSLIILLAVSNSSKAIELLSDERLDQLTAGASITPQYGQNLTQGEVGNIDVADTVSLEVNGIHHTTAGNEIIVSADSQAELLINRVLHLGDSAQVDIKALSISNAVASDLANAINASANHLDESSRLSQINNTSQAELNVASIGLSRWESGYRFDQQQSIHNSSSDSSSFLQESQRNFNHKHTERYNSVNVEIEKYDPRLLLGEIKVGTPNTEPFTLIPAYSGPCSTFAKSCAVPVGDIIDPFEIFGFIPDRVNYEHGWEQTTLELPEFNASLVSESLTKKDLVIRLTAEPPVIDLGAIYFNTQAVFDDEDTPRAIDVNSIDIPATDFPSINVDISAPNPLYGLEMSINSGFALAGQGEIKGDFGSINGLATVNVTNTLESIFPIQPVTDAIQGGIDLVNAIDFLDIFPDIPGPKDFDLDLVIDIPLQIDLNPDNLDLSHSGDVKVVESDHPFHFIYDGVFCFQLFGDGNCGSVLDDTSTTSLVDQSFSSQYTEQISISENSSNDHVQIVRSGAELSDGKAEKIVLSGSELVTQEVSLIKLDTRSQKRFDALNVTNVSTTISANSVNIQAMRQGSIPVLPTASLRLNQSNRFIQTR